MADIKGGIPPSFHLSGDAAGHENIENDFSLSMFEYIDVDILMPACSFDLLYGNIRKKTPPDIKSTDTIFVEVDKETPIEVNGVKSCQVRVDAVLASNTKTASVFYLQEEEEIPGVINPDNIVIGDFNRDLEGNLVEYDTYYKLGYTNRLDYLYGLEDHSITPIDLRVLGYDHLLFGISKSQPTPIYSPALSIMKSIRAGYAVVHTSAVKGAANDPKLTSHSQFWRHIRFSTRHLNANRKPRVKLKSANIVRVLEKTHGLTQRVVFPFEEPPPEPPDPLSAPDNFDSSRTRFEPLSNIEALAIFSIINSNKTAGPDRVPLKTIRQLGDYDNLFKIEDVWNRKLCSRDFQGTLYPIPKKNVSPEIDFRPIVAQNLIAKIYEARLLPLLERLWRRVGRPWQAGFTRGKNTISNIIWVHAQMKEGKTLLFLDFKAAFNLIKHEAVRNALRHYGLDEYIPAIMTPVELQSWKIDELNSFLPNSGVPQGSILSPSLFKITLQYLVEAHTDVTQDEIRAYADDIVLSSANRDRLLSLLKQFNTLSPYGLILNKRKCGTSKDVRLPEIPFSPNYSYLGCPIKTVASGKFFVKYLEVLKLIGTNTTFTPKQRFHKFQEIIGAKMSYSSVGQDDPDLFRTLLSSKLAVLHQLGLGSELNLMF